MALAGAATLGGWPAASVAQGFAAYVSPPRFEVTVAPGATLRQVIDIQHVGRQKGNYRVYTNDWTLGADNTVNFSDALAPDSCRPWVAIERREFQLNPGSRYRYRFEITPPAGTPPRECRFALMIEGLDAAQVQGSVNFPVGGRIGVIVYAAIGGAAPQLDITAFRVEPVNGQATVMMDVQNSGNAHGRLEGFVDGTDANDQRLEFSPTDMPILPGETRRIALLPVAVEGKPTPSVAYPLRIKGQLEWGSERIAVDQRLAP